MSALQELAERCEKATGPSAHLDVQILILLDPDAQHIVGQEPGPFPRKSIYGPRSSYWEWALDETKGPPQFAAIPAYTASLDAAMTLVDAYDRIELGGWERGQAGTWATISLDTLEFEGQAATPALALCAAALRARAAQGGDQ